MTSTSAENKPQTAQTKPAEGHGHAADETGVPKDLPRPRWFTIIGLALLFVVLMAGLFFIGWVPHHAAEEQIKSDAAEREDDMPVVMVANPTLAADTRELVLPCDVRADQETAVFPRTSGYLKARKVDIQDRVKAGDLLAVIDSPEVDAQLDQARGALKQAQAAVEKSTSDLKLAKRTLDRYYDLRKASDVVTAQELEEKENARTQAEGALAQARADVIAAEATVNRYSVLQGFEKVVAPFDGVITARNYDVGALLSATDNGSGKEMFRITKIDKLRVFVNVPQINAAEIKIPSTARLEVRGRKLVEGNVVRNSNAVDPNTRTMLFEMHFDNSDGSLYPGMYGMARLQLSQDKKPLTIPVAALRFDAKGTQVAVVKGDTVHLQQVTLGRDLGSSLEVTSGLSPDDQVVTNLSERVNDGTRVKVSAPAKVAETVPAAPETKASTR